MLENTNYFDDKLSILYTTLSSLNEAEQFAKQVVEQGLAACINIIPGTQSVYLWEGTVKTKLECVVIMKTTPGELYRLEQWVLDNHPYDIPAILKWEIGTSQAFYDYISSHVSKKN